MYLIFFLFILSVYCTPDLSNNYRGAVWIGGSKLRNPEYDFSSVEYGDFVIPPPRRYAAIWQHENSVILFGGGVNCQSQTCPAHYLNDLYVTGDGANWQYIAGCATADAPGLYNGYNNASIPKSRGAGSRWKIKDKIFLYGGCVPASSMMSGFVSDLHFAYADDVIENDITQDDSNTTFSWTWLNGCNSINSLGSYVGWGLPGWPKVRQGEAIWVINNTAYLMFGHFELNGASEFFSDLFSFDEFGNCIWVNGTQDANVPGEYPSDYNMNGKPPPRAFAVTWQFENSVWIYGGQTENSETLNDIWRTEDAGITWIWIGGVSTTNHMGFYNGIGNIGLPYSRAGSFVLKIENSNHLALLAGGFSEVDGVSLFKDIWVYDISCEAFYLLNGSSSDIINERGIFDEINKFGHPGSRYSHVMFSFGENIYISTGAGFDDNGRIGYISDTWLLTSTDYIVPTTHNPFDFTDVYLMSFTFVPLLVIILFFIKCFKLNMVSNLEEKWEKNYFWLMIFSTINFFSDCMICVYLFHIYKILFFVSIAGLLFFMTFAFYYIYRLHCAIKSSPEIPPDFENRMTEVLSIEFFSVIINPCFLLILKSTFGDYFKFPSEKSPSRLCFYHDIYSLTQFILLCISIFYHLPSFILSDWYFVLFWIIIVCKIPCIVIGFMRIYHFFAAGGGRDAPRKVSLRYGLHEHYVPKQYKKNDISGFSEMSLISPPDSTTSANSTKNEGDSTISSNSEISMTSPSSSDSIEYKNDISGSLPHHDEGDSIASANISRY